MQSTVTPASFIAFQRMDLLSSLFIHLQTWIKQESVSYIWVCSAADNRHEVDTVMIHLVLTPCTTPTSLTPMYFFIMVPPVLELSTAFTVFGIGCLDFWWNLIFCEAQTFFKFTKFILIEIQFSILDVVSMSVTININLLHLLFTNTGNVLHCLWASYPDPTS